METFDNANQAFVYYYDKINQEGEKWSNTLALFEVSMRIINPMKNKIIAPFRKWSFTYALKEWDWYLSGDPNAEKIAQKANIWRNHMDEYGNVNSNYGWQWLRGEQLQYVISTLHRDPYSRRASITIYDGKENAYYKYDTPCTHTIHFYIKNGLLMMSVNMRSNDLWFGFCNDQFCFSNLQEYVASQLNIPVGNYYHYVNNLHLYESQSNAKQAFELQNS